MSIFLQSTSPHLVCGWLPEEADQEPRGLQALPHRAIPLRRPAVLGNVCTQGVCRQDIQRSIQPP